jgi:signal transduction histidine kinase
MTRFRLSTSSDLLPLGILGTLGIGYSLVASHWHHQNLIFTLTLLVFIIELFPIRLGKVNFTCAFPLLYTMAVTSDFASTTILSVAALLVAYWIRGRTGRTLIFNASTRVIALLATDFFIRAVNQLYHFNPQPMLHYYLIHLFVSVIVFTAVSHFLVIKYVVRRMNNSAILTVVRKWGYLNIVVCYVYGSFMLWLASDPKNTGSGTLGTVFFFLPLVALTIVVHLITNLTRAKSGLETLFTVSQSINQQLDLPCVLHQIIGEANRLVQGDCGFLYLVDENGMLVRESGTSDDPSIEQPIALGTGLIGRVAQTGEPLMIQDVSREPNYRLQATLRDMSSVLMVPIPIDGNIAGVIVLGKKETHSFHADDLKMMTIFATHTSVAMKNALYIEEREKRLLLEERNRLAREMHDGLAQDLASSLLQIEMIKRTAEPEQFAELDRLQQSLRHTAATVRHSIYSLRPQPYSHVGLVPAIRALLEEVTVQSPLRTRLETNNLPESLPPAISQAIFEIVTEGVKNAVKHAEASDLQVLLQQEHAVLRLVIRDNGKGFHFGQAILHAAARKSFGIENLHAIADQVGGSLDFLTAPGQGTTITLDISLEEDTP